MNSFILQHHWCQQYQHSGKQITFTTGGSQSAVLPFMAVILEDRGPVLPHNMIIQFAGYSPSSSHSIQMEPLQTHQKLPQEAPLMVFTLKNNIGIVPFQSLSLDTHRILSVMTQVVL